jgi:hypothetical protein
MTVATIDTLMLMTGTWRTSCEPKRKDSNRRKTRDRCSRQLEHGICRLGDRADHIAVERERGIDRDGERKRSHL